MRVINPDYIGNDSPVEAEISAKEAELRAWFAGHTDKERVTFKKIRNIFNKTVEQWPDNLIHKKLEKWGFKVVPG